MKTTACRILDTMKIPYTLLEYAVKEDELDAVTVANKIGMPPDRVYKTLVLHGDKTGIVMCCIPGDAELDLKALASASGNKKVEMVPVKDIQGLTGYIRGGVSPLGTKKRYPLFLESTAQTLDTMCVSAGKRGLQLTLRGTDLAKATNATLVSIIR